MAAGSVDQCFPGRAYGHAPLSPAQRGPAGPVRTCPAQSARSCKRSHRAERGEAPSPTLLLGGASTARWPAGANNTLPEVKVGAAWEGPTERDVINEGSGRSETDSDGEHECGKARRRGRDGDVTHDLLPRSEYS